MRREKLLEESKMHEKSEKEIAELKLKEIEMKMGRSEEL